MIERKNTPGSCFIKGGLCLFFKCQTIYWSARKKTRGQVSKFNQLENNLHFMKKYIGLIILVIAFVAFTGCTQQAVPEPVTTTPPTTIATSIPTAELTIIKTFLPTTIVTTMPPTTIRTESPTHNAVTVIQFQNIHLFLDPGRSSRIKSPANGGQSSIVEDDFEGGFNSVDTCWHNLVYICKWEGLQ
jgi:hypothetical protein